ncbi:MAG: molybdopterin-dependent oxidoreductase [Myxococcota bacterium]
MSQDNPKLPPGQVRTTRFPPIGEREPTPEALDREGWRLEVGGHVAQPHVWTWDMIMALPQQERVVDVHCVTGWSRLGTTIVGVPLAEVLNASVPHEDAQFVHFEAYSERRHDTSLPLEVALEDTWLIHGVDGAPLPVKHGGPLRTVIR